MITAVTAVEALILELRLDTTISILYTGPGGDLTVVRALCQRAGLTASEVDAPASVLWFSELEAQVSEVVIVTGALSRSTERQDPALRERLIALKRSILLVEPEEMKGELPKFFPGFFRGGFSQYSLSSDHQFDTGNSYPLSRIASTLPPAVTRGETLIVGGRVRRKSTEILDCPACGKPMRRGSTTITFHDAPEAMRVQNVDGWISDCGESYVPGSIAKEAHKRAFAMPSTVSPPPAA